MLVADACTALRPGLSGLGAAAGALTGTLDAVARAAGGRPACELDSPALALDALVAGADASLLGPMLDLLRAQRDQPRDGAPPARRTLSEAVAEYEAGPLALMAAGTGHTYRTWTRRLVAAHGANDPARVTAGDLRDLIAMHVATSRKGPRPAGRGAEENAVFAFRHLWAYLCQKRYASEDVARELHRPTRIESDRRAFRRDEAALLRSLAGVGRDPLLDRVTLALCRRARRVWRRAWPCPTP